MPTPNPQERPLPKAVAASTTHVTMSDLTDKGVEDLRVLSESKFLHLVNRLVEEAVVERLTDGKEGPEKNAEILVLRDTLGQADEDRMVEVASEDSDEFNSRWHELRQKHIAALENIEARLSNLGEAVVGMEGALGSKPKDPEDAKRKELLHRALARRKKAARQPGAK